MAADTPRNRGSCRSRLQREASTALCEGGGKTFRDVLDDRLAALNDEDGLVQAQMGQATSTVLTPRVRDRVISKSGAGR